MQSVARLTLAKARFFLDRAEEATPNQRDAFCNYLEASIVFARSVTFHLQKEFSDRPDFNDWYASQQKSLADSQLARFLLEQRNYVLKEGPVPTHRVLEMTMTASIHLSGSATVKVIRGAPWYRRSPRILFKDAIYPLRNRLHSYRQRRTEFKARARLQPPQSSGVTRDAIYFSETEWRSTPAIDLVRRQLGELEDIVSEAERRFLSAPKPGSDKNAA